jgi:hypothetical protein
MKVNFTNGAVTFSVVVGFETGTKTFSSLNSGSPRKLNIFKITLSVKWHVAQVIQFSLLLQRSILFKRKSSLTEEKM